MITVDLSTQRGVSNARRAHGRLEERLRVLAVLILLPFASTAALADSAYLIECDGCTAQDMRLDALDYGNGDHHVYDLTLGQLRRFKVTGWMQAQELTPLSSVAAAFEDMRTLQAQDPTIFTAVQQSSVSLAVLPDGPHDPFAVGIGAPNGGNAWGPHNNFLGAVRSHLGFGVSHGSHSFVTALRLMRALNSIGVSGFALSWNFQIIYEFSFVDSDGNSVTVRVDTRRETVEYVGARDRHGNDIIAHRNPSEFVSVQFPNLDHAREYFSGLQRNGVRGDDYVGAQSSSGYYYITCVFIGGELDSCIVETRRN